ncbi:unnamed protein product [Knipowitschia caucasica]|uniref:Pyrin domain-containing protein n=1 Tax=Knipowitschia caucasica TaxID=637954 RepID=A0AAV2J334_KNICA
MEPSTEEDRFSEEEDTRDWQRPPSSYGSMKSEDEDDTASGMEEDDKEQQQCDLEVAVVFNRPTPVLARDAEVFEGAGVQMNRPTSPESQYTMTTIQTKPPGAIVIEASRAFDIEPFTDGHEDEDEYDEDGSIVNSPEPPEAIELEDDQTMDSHGQPGRLHPDQDLPHVFRNIQEALKDLNKEELYKFKINFHQRQSDFTLKQMFDGDLLDFVDKIIEVFGQDRALLNTISTLDNITKKREAQELQVKCKKALIRSSLKLDIIRKYEYIFEGVPQPGRRNLLDEVYVEPEIVHYACGGGPSHEHVQSPGQTAAAGSLVSLNNLFRMQRPDGRPVRTVLTSGIAGIGLTTSVGKYCYDWTKHRANKDLQYVITLPFSSLWILRNRNPSGSEKMSIMDVIEYHHSLCKSKMYLEDAECKFLIIMDSFDCYQTALDWKNSVIINELHTPASMDDLIVNLIGGTLLPNAQLWILGRQGAVSHIPSEHVDAFTEMRGFNEAMKENYLTRRFLQKRTEIGAKIVAHYKKLPVLCDLTRQPFICWMVAKIFGHNFENKEAYGRYPPKLTPFFVNTVIIQTNRRLQFYYNQPENSLKWSDEDQQMLRNLGKMAMKMLEQRSPVFSEEDVKAHGLDVSDVSVFSGLCTELLPTSSGQRRFRFIHNSVQEFMAALYAFTLFHVESKNVLEDSRSGRTALAAFVFNPQSKSAADLVQCAIERTFTAPREQYDMFLRFLCGLLSPDNNSPLGGYLYPRSKDKGVQNEVKLLLERTMQTCPQDRLENIQECLRELTQVDL